MDNANASLLAKNYFIDALRPPSIRAEVRRANVQTLGEAQCIAQREEDILQAEANASNVNDINGLGQSQIAALQNPSDKDESFRTKIDERIRQLEQKLEDNIQAVEKLMQSVKRGNRKCYNCGQSGHIQRFCKLPPQNLNNSTNGVDAEVKASSNRSSSSIAQAEN